MSLNLINIQIESQKKLFGNYIKLDAISLRKDVENSTDLNEFQRLEIFIPQ